MLGNGKIDLQTGVPDRGQSAALWGADEGSPDLRPVDPVHVLLETNDFHFIFRLAAMLPQGAQLRIVPPDSDIDRPAPSRGAYVDDAPRMTPRQRDVATLLQRGLSNKEIARELGLSHFTVRNHISQILRLVGAATRRGAIHRLERILRSGG